MLILSFLHSYVFQASLPTEQCHTRWKGLHRHVQSHFSQVTLSFLQLINGTWVIIALRPNHHTLIQRWPLRLMNTYRGYYATWLLCYNEPGNRDICVTYFFASFEQILQQCDCSIMLQLYFQVLEELTYNLLQFSFERTLQGSNFLRVLSNIYYHSSF